MFASTFLAFALSVAGQTDPVAACQARVQSYAGWNETPETEWAFVAPAASGGGILSYFGAEHSRDPDHPQYAAIDQAFVEARPSVVFYEGPDRGVGSDAADTISTRGESGYARFLAAGAGARIRPLEPSPLDQAAALLPEFGAERVMLFFVLREAARLRDREHLHGAGLDQAVSQILAGAARLMQGPEAAVPFRDLAGLEAAYRTWWSDGSDWRAAPSNWFDPGADDALTGGRFMGAINRASSEFRDRHMYAVLAEAARSGERVFAVVGRNHVPMQAPALACALAAPA